MQNPRGQCVNETPMEQEVHSCWYLTGDLASLESAVILHTSYFEYYMRRHLARLGVENVCQGRTMLNNLRALRAVFTYRTPRELAKEAGEVVTFYGASSSVSKTAQYRPKWFIAGICFGDESSTYHRVEVIDLQT